MKKTLIAIILSMAVILSVGLFFVVANNENTTGEKTVAVKLSSNTGENTAQEYYTTTFSVKASVNTLSQPTEDGMRFVISESIVFADNIVSIDFLDYPDTYPQNLIIKKSQTADGKEFYAIQAYLEKWTNPDYYIYPKFIVLSTGELNFYKSDFYEPTILNIETDIEDKDAIDDIMGKLDEAIANQNSDGLDRLWEIVRPIVVYCISGLLTGVIVGELVSHIIKRKYDAKALSKEILSQLTTKDISIDLETLTKKQLAVIGTTLQNNLQSGLGDLSNLKKTTALMCKALSKSKLLTQEEREELITGASTLNEEIANANNEKVVVRLDKTDVTENSDKNMDGGLFGYMEK